MFKPGPDMLRGDRPERHTQRLDQAFEGAGLGRAQRLLGLGPTQLDRVEVGRVGRQVQHTRAAGFAGGYRFDIPMGRQVVQPALPRPSSAFPQPSRQQSPFPIQGKGRG